MLSYQDDRKLERLLEELFSDDDDLTSDGIIILNRSIGPIFSPSANCCSLNYSNYSS